MRACWLGIIVVLLPAAVAFGVGMRVVDTTIRPAPGKLATLILDGVCVDAILPGPQG